MGNKIEQYITNTIDNLDMGQEFIANILRQEYILTKDVLPSRENISILPHFRHANFLPEYQNFHKHAFFELVYVYQGTATQYSKTGSIKLETGSILLMNTNYWHGLSTETRDDMVFNILISPEVLKTSFLSLLSENDLFYKFFIDDLFSEDKMGDYILCSSSDAPRAIKNLDLLIDEWIQKLDCYQSACTAYLSLVFTEIFRTHMARRLGSHKDKMADIVKFIQENLDRVTLSDLAARYHYSNEHMSRVIKSLFGKNFKGMLLDMRMEHAVFLMKNTTDSIDSIALRLGYYDRSHFNRVFKKKYGCTPNEYK